MALAGGIVPVAEAAQGGQGAKQLAGFEAQVKELTTSGAARSFQKSLSALAESTAPSELASTVSTNTSTPLTGSDQSALSITTLLDTSKSDRLLHLLGTGRQPSAGELANLKSVLGKLGSYAAIKELVARGEMLKRHPQELRRAIRSFVARMRSTANVAASGNPREDPIGALADTLWENAQMPGGSLGGAVAELLSEPGAVRYLRSLSPLALAALDPPEGQGPAARASDVAGSGGDACSEAELQTLVGTARGAALSLPDALMDEATKHLKLKVIWTLLPDYYKTARSMIGVGNPLTAILKTMGWSAAETAYPLVRNAVVDCYAQRIVLTPAQQTVVAGTWLPYKIAIFGKSGEQFPSDWINDADTMTISPVDDPADQARCDKRIQWECWGEKAGRHQVRATLRGLTAEGVMTVEPGPPTALTVVPATATVGVGEASPAYKATGEDKYRNATADIIPGHAGKDGVRAHLSMFPADGPCSDVTATCTPGAPGPHNIIIEREDGVRNHATLEVEPNLLKLSPLGATAFLGTLQFFTAEEVSEVSGKSLGPVSFGTGPGQARISISPDGTCNQISGYCNPATAGPHTVRAVTDKASGEVSIEVEVEPKPESAYAYVAESVENTLAVIDVATNSTIASIALGGEPEGPCVDPDGEFVYVPTFAAETLYVVDAATRTVSDTIRLPNGGNWCAVAPDGKHVYVNSPQGYVYVIDTETDTIMAEIPTGEDPQGIAISPDGYRLFVAADYSLIEISTTTDTIQRFIYGDGGFIENVAVAPDDATVYFTAGNSVESLNLEGGGEQIYGPLPSRALGVAVTPDGKKLYVGLLYANPVSIDVADHEVREVGAGTNLEVGWGIAVTADGKRVYGSGGPGTAYAALTATNAVLATPSIGSTEYYGGYGVALGPEPGS